MSHDPYQTQQTLGAFSGLTNPFGSPYGTMQASMLNPGFGGNPFTSNLGYTGISPQQLQIAAALASQAAQMSGASQFNNPWQQQQNPFGNIYQNPIAQLQQIAQVQHQIAHAILQNPAVAAALQNQLATVAHQQNPYGNVYQQNPFQHNPFQQNPYQQNPYQQQGLGSVGQPFAQSTLAPQSWVGQGQMGQQGQVNPLVLQSIARAMNPWGTF